MARISSEDRFEQLIECATETFMAYGYRHTQIDAVARRMQVAPGTIYRYVESKEALFELVLRATMTDAPRTKPETVPWPTPAPDDILTLVQVSWSNNIMPALTAALDRETAEDVRAEMREIIAELYTRITRRRHALQIIMRSALEWPELSVVFYKNIRRGIIGQLTDYLELRVRHQQLRPIPYPATAARFILESVSWFALHRQGDADSAMITDAMALETVLDALSHAFLPEPR